MKLRKSASLILIALMSVFILAACSNEAKIAIEKPEDLAGKKIGVQEGTTGDAYVTENVAATATVDEATVNTEIARFKKPTDAALDLKNGKLDAIVLDKMPAQKIVEKNSDLQILEFNLTEEDYSIAIPKDKTDLTAKINESLKRIKEDGTYNILIDKFMNNEEVELPVIPQYAPEGKLVMGTNAEFEPFEYRDDKGEITGFDVELAKQIAVDLKLELVIEDMAFDSLTAALSSGKVDVVIAGMTATDEKRQQVDFSDSYYSASQVIIVKK
ncbi:MAG: transporter substrate-binding domain-containing protein [Clostridiales bacterium]